MSLWRVAPPVIIHYGYNIFADIEPVSHGYLIRYEIQSDFSRILQIDESLTYKP